MKNALKCLNKFSPRAGFTLAELLLAAAMTLIVVSGAGYALLTILKNNKMANATSETQSTYNRAVEFISEEIKGANSIDTTIDLAKAPQFKAKYEGKVKSGEITPILSIEIDGVQERIVYYLHNKKMESERTVWAGPQVLYRWGPFFDNNGVDDEDEDGDGDTKESRIYINADDATAWNQGEALLDLVASNIDNDKKRCKNPTWRRLPVPDASYGSLGDSSDTQIKGFFICVRDGGTNGDLAELHAHANIEVNTARNPIKYDIVTQVFTRAVDVTIDTPDDGPKLDITTMLIDKPAKVTAELITGDPKCLKNQVSSISVQEPGVEAVLGDLGVAALPDTVTGAAGNEVIVSSGKGVCSLAEVDSYTGMPNSAVAKNGTLLSEIAPNPSADYTALAELLGAKGLLENGAIKLNNNEALVFLESLPSSVITTETDTNLDDAIIVIKLNNPTP